MKETEWFPADIKPVREGVYETISPVFGERGWFCYWSGKYWCQASFDSGSQARSIIHANAIRIRSSWQDRRWRGLAQKP